MSPELNEVFGIGHRDGVSEAEIGNGLMFSSRFVESRMISLCGGLWSKLQSLNGIGQ